jgi:elongation factor G
LQHTLTSDTLCAASNVIAFEKLVFPEPCISLAVTAKAGRRGKVFSGLHKFEEEIRLSK